MYQNKEKIGIGLITYNSPERLKKSAFTIPVDMVDEFVIVNDGTPYPPDCYPTGDKIEVITHEKNLSVGCAKNTAIRRLMEKGVDHIFIMEDDITIINPEVFNAYITTAYKTGLFHMMFGYHGPANMKDGMPNPRQVVDYGNDVSIALNLHCVGAFCYYHKGVIKNAGLFDEYFKNCWEHVSHSYTINKLGLIPAYWWWPDLPNSTDYLKEIGSSTDQSVIRKSEEWISSLKRGHEYFNHYHGYYPTQVPDIGEQAVLGNLQRIFKDYAREII